MKKLSEHEAEKLVAKLNGWVFLDISISKEFIFNDFSSAIDFVNAVASTAEKIGHHPDILLHETNKVKIYNSTYSAGGVTQKDFELAEEIDKLKSF